MIIWACPQAAAPVKKRPPPCCKGSGCCVGSLRSVQSTAFGAPPLPHAVLPPAAVPFHVCILKKCKTKDAKLPSRKNTACSLFEFLGGENLGERGFFGDFGALKPPGILNFPVVSCLFGKKATRFDKKETRFCKKETRMYKMATRMPKK